MGLEKETKNAKNTERLIQDALISLYREKPLSKIKISEISERCHVSRATFYFHFSDIYDCLEKIEDELLDGIGTLMNAIVIETVKRNENRENFVLPYTHMLDYIAENHEYFHALLFGSESSQFREKYVRNIEGRFRLSLEMDGRTPKDLIPYCCALYSGAILHLFSYWLRSNMDKPSRQIADIAYQALFSGLMNPEL